MATEQYSIGYEEGFQNGWNAAVDSLPAQRKPHDCARSHPHENMDVICELRTEIARLTNENARLKAQPQQEPEIVQRVKRYAGQTLRTARNPNITARECIELANWLAAHGIKGDA